MTTEKLLEVVTTFLNLLDLEVVAVAQSKERFEKVKSRQLSLLRQVAKERFPPDPLPKKDSLCFAKLVLILSPCIKERE